MLACHCKLAALLLDFREEVCVLDRQNGLCREGLQQIDGVLGKFARCLPAYHQRADDPVDTEQWYDQQGAETGADDDIEHK